MIPAKNLPAPEDRYPVRRALLSVYDKTDVTDFASRLAAHDVELISTGGTAAALRKAGLAVTDVSSLTGFPEILGGRVKTMHPAIAGGVLARRTDQEDLEELRAHDAQPIDLIVVNLYPFEEASSDREAPVERVTENIDIGGPTLLRSAAKNFAFVAAAADPRDYEDIADEMDENDGALSRRTRQRLARRAFEHTAHYDRLIAEYFGALPGEDAANGADDRAEGTANRASSAEGTESASGTDGGVRATGSATDNANGGGLDISAPFPTRLHLAVPRLQELRYGENPHQEAALYGQTSSFLEKLHGKDLSFNNLIDASAALALIDEFRDAAPTCAILKHTNPCGVATAERLEQAYQRAFSTDRQSPFGGIVVVNRALDRNTAEAIDRIFTEVIIAPDYEEGVLDLLKQKKNRRLLKSLRPFRREGHPDIRSIAGGLLVQERDPVLPRIDEQKRSFDVVTKRSPTDAEWRDLIFAWRVVKHVKSNAIVYARDGSTLGVGAGQMSRIDASELAVRKGQKSELDFEGSVVASDAFFPFADGLVAAAKSGARAAIQPGGSIRDEEVIEAADQHDIAMVCTGRRHFRH